MMSATPFFSVETYIDRLSPTTRSTVISRGMRQMINRGASLGRGKGWPSIAMQLQAFGGSVAEHVCMYGHEFGKVMDERSVMSIMRAGFNGVSHGMRKCLTCSR